MILRKFKKLNIVVKTIILALILGFVMAFLYYQGIIYKLSTGITSIHFLWHIAFLFISFFVTLTIHELGHLVAFILKGIKIRALHIFIFVFYRNHKGLRFAVDFKLVKLLGGLVVPQIGDIKNEEGYLRITKKFKFALIAGPNTTKWFLISYLIITLLVIALTNNYLLIGILFSNVLWVVGFSLLYLKASRLHNDSFYGDYVAYDKMGEDEVFTFVQLDQYLIFNLKTSDETKVFMENKNLSLLLKNPYKRNIFIQNLYLKYLNSPILPNLENKDLLDVRIKQIFNYQLISKSNVDVLVSLICYYYENSDFDNFVKAYMLLFSKNDDYLITYQKLVDHKLGFADNSLYLINHKNDIIDLYWIFKRIINLDNYFDEVIRVLNYKAIESEIICYLEDNYEK